MNRQLMDGTPHPLNDPKRGIFGGYKASPRLLRRMAESARADAERLEDEATQRRGKADMYDDIADARERGEL